MRIKKYTASSMKEALLMIKKELGEEAMILKTRNMPKKMFSFGDQKSIEVTAAIDENETKPQPPLAPLKVSDPGVYNRPGAAKKPAPARPEPQKSTPTLAPKVTVKKEEKKSDDDSYTPGMTDSFNFLELRDGIYDMKVLLASILATGETAAAGGFAGPWAVLYKRLIDSEISEEIAVDLIQRLKNTTDSPDKTINKKFINVLKECFPVSGPFNLEDKGPLRVAFVGPTGAGKTTTIAKLAAYYYYNRKKTVSLITADTYRIAAIEQIRAFAEIVDIGLQVVFSPEEVAEALEACENDDVVFVDTAGRSQRNTEHMQELEELLSVLKPNEVHLVLSATTKDSDLHDTIKRYKTLGVNRLLFTKLDETVRLGNIFNIVSQSAIPASYLTFGQSVPDDIELAQSGRFIQKLLEGSSI